MKQNIPEEFPTGSMDWSRFVIKGGKMPPRDPDDEDEDEDEEGEEEGDDDEPAVVREPDED
ncbi:hypothetical protein [Bradyrhizobium sp. WSM2254]|uniref:hypothetical protein n=1 Tax=Bradyrhizobium sp. WSM2254 TaxID=1188263 RepID=UPI00041DDE87|nr:hypothetical protein [Bradyrhizobium sp. WSM2254]